MSLAFPFHQIRFLDRVGASDISTYWRQTAFPSILGTLVRGSPTFGSSDPDPELQVTETVYSNIPVRVYEPLALTGKTNRPVIVFFHGGWASLGLDIYEPIAREVAKSVSAVVVAVRFRVPPQHIHPAALDDCVKVTEHIIHQAHVHDFDPNRVAVAGDGAGGQLAAAVAIKVKKFIKMQTPSYIENRKYLTGMRNNGDLLSSWMRYGNIPAEYLQDFLDNRHTSSSVKKSRWASYVSPSHYTAQHIRTPQLISQEKSHNFGDEAVSDKFSSIITDPLFAPLMANDQDFLYVPSLAYIVTAGYDVTRDDGLIYWRRLKNAEIKAKLAHYEDGFQNMLAFAPVRSRPTSVLFQFTFDIGRKVLADLVDFLLDNL
ncbi:arylacetamide deacetylase-like 1 [Elysia marginata]|uniref:Arylacetamide deacetylase-like 1 n=1 Tax=Elysia marginata TaxID=1093978 RepID=A0AAV4EK19_9GAST|nr:arylacetamide deacetylase-like 1 [Elysia marginata]